MTFLPVEDFLSKWSLPSGADTGMFPEVAEAAQPFLAALILRQITGRAWVVCRDLKSQEDFAAEMASWCGRVRLFPDAEAPPDGALPDQETASERLELLRTLASPEIDSSEVVVIHADQWSSKVPEPAIFGRHLLVLKQRQEIDPALVARTLLEAGYERCGTVAARGQFAIRGGIVDVFSWQAPRPFRLEWFDLEIDSIREFDPDSQCSITSREMVEILTTRSAGVDVPLESYRRPGDAVLHIETLESSAGLGWVGSGGEARPGFPVFHPAPFSDLGAGDIVLNEAKRDQFFNQLHAWRAAEWTIVFACAREGEAERFAEMAGDFDLDVSGVRFLQNRATRGFVCPQWRLAVLSEAEVLGRSATQRAQRAALRRERVRGGRGGMDFSEFEAGDLVVHLDHGIGRFEGMQASPDGPGEVLVLEFANEARLYVPIEHAWQVARYVGLGKKNPDLSELGGARWNKAKEKAGEGIYQYAARMLKVQAERETAEGHAFPPDSRWMQEFERSFPFTETPDQARAILDAKSDMESTRAMDRLICGDVGFGKTEVAIRAAFKAVTSGRQAAVIAPTTVLAQQHWQNFRERMSEYPVRIELLSRYRTAAEQKEVLRGLADGSVDLVVGTHRVISPDVVFKNLGLVVVDEEQRFGVRHKDSLKEKFRLVDVLTLSATPIPRTLYLSLMGARDMSVIETPPSNRLPVETLICGYDERIIRDAVSREIARGGQVYFLHNRIGTIERVAQRIHELCPSARVIVGHGQMEEKQLESVMQSFVAGQADVLVSTTIIESGLDIPNANTIVIDRADRFGLADLYQLRGRVGRSGVKAYAYLLLPRELMAVGAARKRVAAIKQYTELGSGFKIAMRDLEIRGAGNLLGTEQSGHIIAVGFDLYCKMLRRAVESVKSRTRPASPVVLRLDFVETEEARFRDRLEWAGAFLPASYMPDSRWRIEAYRRLAEVGNREELDALRAIWRDRFGPLPEFAENALSLGAIRIEAARRRIFSVEVKDGKIMLTRRGGYHQIDGRFPRLTLSEATPKVRELLEFLEKLPVP